MKSVLENLKDLLSFIFPQNAIIDKDTAELVAYGPVDEGRHDR